MSKVNSIRKGKSGEREWARLCRGQGFTDARRSQQYAGGVEESADIVGLPYIHVEVKFYKAITDTDILGFLRQAIRDNAGNSNLPIVAHRVNNHKWYVSMDITNFIEMTCAAEDINTEFMSFNLSELLPVTMTAENWFKVYKEYYSAIELRKREEK